MEILTLGLLLRKLLVLPSTAQRLLFPSRLFENPVQGKGKRFYSSYTPPQFSTVAPHVSPPPNPQSTNVSPSETLPSSIASCKAIGIDAEDMFPYRSKFTTTF